MEQFNIPEGFVLRKIGGRPKNTARNVAVLMAKYWRTNYWDEPANVADEWIVCRWTWHGINDGAHVRRAVRAARADLKNMTLIFSGQYAAALTFPATEGDRGWLWAEGLTSAYPVELRNLPAKFVQDSHAIAGRIGASRQVVPLLG